jgi:hypothetical protein
VGGVPIILGLIVEGRLLETLLVAEGRSFLGLWCLVHIVISELV